MPKLRDLFQNDETYPVEMRKVDTGRKRRVEVFLNKKGHPILPKKLDRDGLMFRGLADNPYRKDRSK